MVTYEENIDDMIEQISLCVHRMDNCLRNAARLTALKAPEDLSRHNYQRATELLEEFDAHMEEFRKELIAHSREMYGEH